MGESYVYILVCDHLHNHKTLFGLQFMDTHCVCVYVCVYGMSVLVVGQCDSAVSVVVPYAVSPEEQKLLLRYLLIWTPLQSMLVRHSIQSIKATYCVYVLDTNSAGWLALSPLGIE